MPALLPYSEKSFKKAALFYKKLQNEVLRRVMRKKASKNWVKIILLTRERLEFSTPV